MNTENELPPTLPERTAAPETSTAGLPLESDSAVALEAGVQTEAATQAGAEAAAEEAAGEVGRKWREGRIVDAVVRIWDAAECSGVAEVVAGDGNEPPLSVFLLSDLFAATDLSPQPGRCIARCAAKPPVRRLLVVGQCRKRSLFQFATAQPGRRGGSA